MINLPDLLLVKTNINEMVEVFTSIHYAIYDKSFPKKTVTMSNKDPYCITPEIKFIINQKNSLISQRALLAIPCNARKAYSRLISELQNLNHKFASVFEPSLNLMKIIIYLLSLWKKNEVCRELRKIK